MPTRVCGENTKLIRATSCATSPNRDLAAQIAINQAIGQTWLDAWTYIHSQPCPAKCPIRRPIRLRDSRTEVSTRQITVGGMTEFLATATSQFEMIVDCSNVKEFFR